MCRQLAASLAQQEAEYEALRVGTVGGMHQRISGLSEELAQRSAQLADLQGSHADLQQQMAAATAQLEQGGTERRALQAAYEGKVRQSLSCDMIFVGILTRVLSAEPCKQPDCKLCAQQMLVHDKAQPRWSRDTGIPKSMMAIADVFESSCMKQATQQERLQHRLCTLPASQLYLIHGALAVAADCSAAATARATAACAAPQSTAGDRAEAPGGPGRRWAHPAAW